MKYLYMSDSFSRSQQVPKRSRQVAAKYAQKSRGKKADRRPNIPAATSIDQQPPDISATDAPLHEEDLSSYPVYGYVIEDLRRMGITIGLLAVVLVVITIFLR
jgi:hypothetical protein